MSHPAIEGPGPGPTNIPIAAIRAAITGLGIPNFDRIMRITIDAEWVDVQWSDPTGLQYGTRYPVRAESVECPQCHQPAGRPHTDYCSLALREQIFAGQPEGLQYHVSEQWPTSHIDVCSYTWPVHVARIPGERHRCAQRLDSHDSRLHICGCQDTRSTNWGDRGRQDRLDNISSDIDEQAEAREWVDDGCRCPNPDHEHQPGCPVYEANRKCRICGCTTEQGCEPSCWWIEPDLCSNCQP